MQGEGQAGEAVKKGSRRRGSTVVEAAADCSWPSVTGASVPGSWSSAEENRGEAGEAGGNQKKGGRRERGRSPRPVARLYCAAAAQARSPSLAVRQRGAPRSRPPSRPGCLGPADTARSGTG